MAKTKTKSRASYRQSRNFDGVFLLKLVLYVILGSMWLKLSNGQGIDISFPVGIAIGLVFASHEHFRIDRKVEYAALVIAMLVGYVSPYGLYVNF